VIPKPSAAGKKFLQNNNNIFLKICTVWFVLVFASIRGNAVITCYNKHLSLPKRSRQTSCLHSPYQRCNI
jgi:hypothetical protein